MDDVQHKYAQINGIRMHYVMAGSGPLLLLLHGFPEFWYSWRHQIQALRPYFTVVAPDLRGYNETEKPSWGYEMDVLVSDVVELIQHCGSQRAIIIGHDWGGALAWMTAMTYPQRVERLINMNIPHPTLFVKGLRTNPQQMRRSLYMLFFQIPWLPEALFKADNYAAIEHMFRDMAIRKDTFSDYDIAMFKSAIRRPGALTAALNWYRAFMREGRRGLFKSVPPEITIPTMLIWGMHDKVLGVELTHGTEHYAPDLQIRFIPNASHWVQQEQPERVNRYILEFLSDMIEHPVPPFPGVTSADTRSERSI